MACACLGKLFQIWRELNGISLRTISLRLLSLTHDYTHDVLHCPSKMCPLGVKVLTILRLRSFNFSFLPLVLTSPLLLFPFLFHPSLLLCFFRGISDDNSFD